MYLTGVSTGSEMTTVVKNRRLKGKLRAKKSRDRKKQYCDNLEAENNQLRKENQKLRQALEEARIQNFKSLGPEQVNDLEEHKNYMHDIITNFVKKTRAPKRNKKAKKILVGIIWTSVLKKWAMIIC